MGLGAMGSMSAWQLAARGANVIAIERFRPGHDRGSSHGDTRIFRTAYYESPEYVPLLRRAKQLWRQLESESGAELLTLNGGLAIGREDGELVGGVLASAHQNHLPHHVFTAAEAERRFPQHRIPPGDLAVLEDEAGFLRPERSIAVAASAAEALGARLVTDSEVTAVEASGAGVVIETRDGRFAAERALIAAGAWTSKLLPGLGLPLRVERQVLAWLAVANPAAFAPERFPVFMYQFADGRFRYGIPTTDGRSIKLGIHHEGQDADPDSIDREVHEADLQPLRDYARENLRGVGGEVVDACVCMYTNAPDERFIAMSPPGVPGVTVLSACSGHGFKFAPVIGELMAEWILNGRTVPAIIRTA